MAQTAGVMGCLLTATGSREEDVEQGRAFLFYIFFYFCFLGPHPWHMDVPRLGVESELQLLAYTTATAT